MDIAVIFVSGWLVFYFRFESSLFHNKEYLFPVLVQILLTALMFSAHGVYESWRGKNLLEQLFKLIKAWGLSFLILTAIGTLTKTSSIFSREWLILWAAISLLFLLAVKLLVYRTMQRIRKLGCNDRRVVFVGSPDSIRKLLPRIDQSTSTGFKGIACVSVHEADGEKTLPMRMVHGLNKLEEAIARYQPDEVWIVAPISDLEICDRVNYLLRHSTVNIRYLPDLDGTGLPKCPSSQFLGMLSWNVSVGLHSETCYLAKWLEDRILGLCLFVLLSPFMLLIAFAVKLTSPGPVLFRQQRHGWNGKVFEIYKFRTMHAHQEADGTLTQATRNDQRVTKLGAFLRRTNLDELPQFINVLQGRMSVVGPRPHALLHNMEYSEKIEEYMRRHKVKPGITGWAQVNGWRGETDTLEKMKNRVECDFYYIQNWSVWLDLKILLLTLLRSFVDKNAY
jgi:putative colanic acid biosynthesis UDP-glucose lipid carrier transferase